MNANATARTFSRRFSEPRIVRIEDLKGHEETDPDRLNKLMKEIEADGILKKSIAVDENSNVILDGHHRLRALKELGYTKIPVKFVDYNLPDIIVHAWKEGGEVSKEMVVSTAIEGKKFPSRTTKHMVKINGKLEHISVIEKEVNIPLKKLI